MHCNHAMKCPFTLSVSRNTLRAKDITCVVHLWCLMEDTVTQTFSRQILSRHTRSRNIFQFTHPLTQSPTHPLIHSPTQSFIQSFIHIPAHSRDKRRNDSKALISCPTPFIHSFTQSPTHPLIHPLIHSFIHPLIPGPIVGTTRRP